MRRVLGHKKMATTTGFYSGAESAAAALHFDEVILGRLTPQPAAPARRTKEARR